MILVLYDAVADQAYWLHVQGEFQGGKLFELARQGARLTIHVSVHQIVNEKAVQHFRRLKTMAEARWKKGATENA